MLALIERIKLQTSNSLQQLVTKFKLKAALYFVDKLTISMISHLALGGTNLGLSCSFRQFPNGDMELSFFNRANVKRAIQAIKLAKLGLQPELRSGNVYIPLPAITSSRRCLVIKSLMAVLEQFKSNARSIRRRAITELNAIEAVECDLKRIYIKQIEDNVFRTLLELQRLYKLNEQRLA
ncbi:MAG: ribosome recycling factor [Candidatus Hodgkinia cicadicola]